MHRFAGLALEAARELADQMPEQAAKHLPWPLRVGVRERGAGYLLAAEVVELRAVAFQGRFNLAQALRAGQLRVN